MKRVLLFSLGLLLLCIPLVGCDSEESLAAEQIAEIVEGVGTSDMETCTFDMDISATIDIEASDQSMKASVVGGGEGAIDFGNKEMFMPFTIEAEIPFMGSQEMSMGMYIVNGWMYMNMDGEWTKMEAPEEIFGEQDQSLIIGQLVDLLALAEIDHTGSETINGVQCYKFQITPDLAELADYASQQFQQEGLDMDALDLSGLEEMMSSFDIECTFWISKTEDGSEAKDENLLMKIELDLGGELSSKEIPEMGETGFDSMSLDANLVIEFDYDEPVDIQLPTEAQNAYDQGAYEW